MKLKVAKNFEFLLENFSFKRAEQQDKQGFIFEGGSGSAKTYDIIQFLMYYCQINEDKGKDILIFRLTYADLKKTVLKDFLKILKMYDMYDINNHSRSHPQTYDLFGNQIHFTGLDGMGSHGERHDVIWGNEGMELGFDDWKQLNQRCNELFITDYNPSFTEHWIYDSLIKRADTLFLKSTQLDNPFLPKGQRQEILAYEPYLPGSYTVQNNSIMYKGEEVSEKNQPPPHPTNIESGTADEFMWKVYGLGLRGAMKGIIFPNVVYIDKFPDMGYSYGLDFGFTVDPTALVKHAEDDKNIYLELLSYAPMDSPHLINDYMLKIGIEKTIPITADSSDKHTNDRGSFEMVSELYGMGWEISKVSKTGSVMLHIGTMKRKRIHIVKNHFYKEFKKEQENYRLKEINGIAINQPMDKWNHAWDSSRYAHMAHGLGQLTSEWT